MKTFSLKLTACDKIFFNGECQMVILPGSDGEIGILANHERMVTCIEEGTMRIKHEDGEWESVYVSEGIAEVGDNSVNIIVFFAEKPENVEIMKARADYDQAAEELMHKQSKKEYEQFQSQMARALAKLRKSSYDSKIGD